MREPDFFGAIELKTGQSHLFAPKLPDSYAIWSGALKTEEDIRAEYGVDQVHWVDSVRITRPPLVISLVISICTNLH